MTPTARPGGRTARIRAQVLDAVRAELGEHGYDGLTPEAVAARAGVHRATVYRRWGDVGGLLADVLDAAGDDGWEPPDTGSLEGDLTALNEEIQWALDRAAVDHGGADRRLVPLGEGRRGPATALGGSVRPVRDHRRPGRRVANSPRAPTPGDWSSPPPRRSTTGSRCSARHPTLHLPAATRAKTAALAAAAGAFATSSIVPTTAREDVMRRRPS